MNIESIEERLLRAERDRDEASAEVARLRASQVERAIAELELVERRAEAMPVQFLTLHQVKASLLDHTRDRIAALRAEAQAAPSITPSPMDTASTSVRWDLYEKAAKDVDLWPEWKRKAASAAFSAPAKEPVPTEPKLVPFKDLPIGAEFICHDVPYQGVRSCKVGPAHSERKDGYGKLWHGDAVKVEPVPTDSDDSPYCKVPHPASPKALCRLMRDHDSAHWAPIDGTQGATWPRSTEPAAPPGPSLAELDHYATVLLRDSENPNANAVQHIREAVRLLLDAEIARRGGK